MYSSLNIYNQPITQAATTVASPNAAYQRMSQFWDLITDLKEGTYKIRSEHRKYLPQEARETDDSYCLLYTSPSPRDKRQSRMPSSA